MKAKLEYIWLDGYTPEANLRSKTKVIDAAGFQGEVDQCPMWSYDGSSTQQAEGRSSDCLLKPVRVAPDPQRANGYLVLCEVLNPDHTPHATNARATFDDNEEFWFGFEQEYTFVQNGRPLGFPKQGYPNPQGMYYCSVGAANVAGRDIVEEHMEVCLEAGIGITGVNAEVLLGQWEFQVMGKGAKRAADDLWLCRYLLHRITEEHDVEIEFHPKPVKGDWNGSGLHTNFSNAAMRDQGGEAYFKSVCEAFGKYTKEHIAVYGSCNDERLTGLHETQHIDSFSYGVSDRGASIRIPVSVPESGWKGYLEDRRPASNADPYKIVKRIIETVAEVELEAIGAS